MVLQSNIINIIKKLIVLITIDKYSLTCHERYTNSFASQGQDKWQINNITANLDTQNESVMCSSA